MEGIIRGFLIEILEDFQNSHSKFQKLFDIFSRFNPTNMILRYIFINSYQVRHIKHIDYMKSLGALNEAFIMEGIIHPRIPPTLDAEIRNVRGCAREKRYGVMRLDNAFQKAL